MAKFESTSSGITVLLGAITALTPLALDIYLVSMPSMAAAFGTDAGTIQLTLGLYLVGAAVGQLAFGLLSDRLGRRPTLIAGLVIFVLASIACAWAPSVEVLLIARFIQGLGICTGQVVGRAVVRDFSSRERAAQVLSLMALVTGLAPILAPIIGSNLHVWAGWQANFAFVASYGALAVLAVTLGLGETLARPDPEATRPARVLMNFSAMLGNRDFVGYVATNCLMSGGLLAFLSSGSFVLIQVYGLSEQAFGPVFALTMASNLAGAFVGSRVVRQLGIDRMIGLGTACAAVAGMAMCALLGADATHVAAVLVPAAAFVFAFSLVLPQTLAGALSPFPQMAGAASSLLGSLALVFSAMVGAVVGRAFDGTPWPMAIALAVMGTLAFLSHRALIRRRAACPAA